MMIPANAYGVVVFLILLLPGVVFGVVRASIAGAAGHDKETGARILQALLISVLLDAVYLLVLGRSAVEAVSGAQATAATHPRQTALAVLVLGIAVPALLAYVRYGRLHWPVVGTAGRLQVRLPQRRTTFESAPTAWDHVAQQLEGGWVRIRFADGSMIGGWFGANSYISTYPEPRDMYIEDQHHLDADGRILAEIADTGGVWVALRDGDIVEWMNPADDDQEDHAPAEPPAEGSDA